MQQDQVLIICDTNIWYRLADGRITLQDVAGKQLVGTFMSAYEFGCTYNALTSYSLFRNAVKEYVACKTKIKEDPTEYIKMISGHKSIIPQWAGIEKGLANVVQNTSCVITDKVRQEYAQFNQQVDDSLAPFEALIQEHRREITNRGSHKRAMNTSLARQIHKEITKELVADLAGGLALDWDKLELFVSTFDEWIRQLSIQPNLTMTPNDWNDLLTLVYVQPGSLYWTYDAKKTKVFIDNVGLSHYLYK